MKWDYKTIVLTGGFMGRHKEDFGAITWSNSSINSEAKGGSSPGF